MKYTKVAMAGIVATVAMSAFMLVAPLLGLPKMNIGVMLGALFGDNEVAGWILHFIIGIAFAFLYAIIFNAWLPVINDVARGVLYGIILFVFSEAFLLVISLAGYFSWEMKEGMALMVFGNLFASFIYGSVLGGIMKRETIENWLDWERKRYFRKGFGDRKETKFS